MQGIKIFFACALGALIGGLVALQFSSAFWWIGSIVGFVVSYLSYEYIHVFNVVREALKSCGRSISNFRFNSLKQKEQKSWLDVLTIPLLSSVLLLDFYLIICLISCLALGFSFLVQKFAVNILLFYFLYPIGFSTIFFAFLWNFLDWGDMEKRRWVIINLNPISAVCWVIYGIMRGIFFILSNVSGFIRKVLVTIHSDIRLTCGVDGAIGAGIGYFCGNVLIGALAGGVLGVVNYYLVGIKILKLAPVGK